jgi:hypothetical protein
VRLRGRHHSARIAPAPPAAGAPAAAAPVEVESHAPARAPRQTAAASEQRPSAPGPHAPSSGGAPASAPAAGLSLGGFALLAILLCLAGPRLRHRLEIRPAPARPVAFFSLLERPG